MSRVRRETPQTQWSSRAATRTHEQSLEVRRTSLGVLRKSRRTLDVVKISATKPKRWRAVRARLYTISGNSCVVRRAPFVYSTALRAYLDPQICMAGCIFGDASSKVGKMINQRTPLNVRMSDRAIGVNTRQVGPFLFMVIVHDRAQPQFRI
jgi:hypothetical protein